MGDRENMDSMLSEPSRQPRAPRPPRRPLRPRPPRRHLPRWAGLLIVVGVLAGVLAGLILGVGAVIHKLGGGSSTDTDYAGDGSGRVVVQVLPGTAVDIGRTLVKQDVVKSIAAFTSAAQ